MLRVGAVVLFLAGSSVAFTPSFSPAFAPAAAPGLSAQRLAPSVSASKPLLLRPAFNDVAQTTADGPATVVAAGKGIGFPELNGTDMRIGICHSRWNQELVNKLRTGTKESLAEMGIEDDNIVEFEVPGSWELPLAARYMALTQKVDAVICIGVLIKGETDHYDMIKDAATHGIMQLGLETGIPILCGIMGCHTIEQVEARATGDNNHGVWWGKTAVEMATLRKVQMGKASSGASVGEEKKRILF